MRLFRYPQPAPSEITDQRIWRSRRQFMMTSALVAGGAATPFAQASTQALKPLPGKPSPEFMSMDDITERVHATTYNNFYEFGLDKSDPERYAGQMKVSPWQVRVEGEVGKPQTFGIEDLLALEPMQERIYRLRCVEGWSMVIPWVGYPLSALIKKVEPTGNAKYVEFVTDMQPEAMPGLRSSVIDWPYREGLRMDEAMNPLTLLTFGMYGEVLPNQNGAPVRVIVPWKYGFKSGKSIVTIRLTEKQPVSSWMRAASNEYGFYANVNPEVPHPRWSQRTERIIGQGLFAPRRPTEKFNGYQEQVASMYAGMDLAKFY